MREIEHLEELVAYLEGEIWTANPKKILAGQSAYAFRDIFSFFKITFTGCFQMNLESPMFMTGFFENVDRLSRKTERGSAHVTAFLGSFSTALVKRQGAVSLKHFLEIVREVLSIEAKDLRWKRGKLSSSASFEKEWGVRVPSRLQSRYCRDSSKNRSLRGSGRGVSAGIGII